MKSLWDKNKFEATLRIGIMSCLGFTLSVANIPKVVPPSERLMPGLLAAVFSQILPQLMFTLMGVFPIVLTLFTTTCVWVTMLLAAGTVSKGLFVGIYAVYSLLMTTLFFGKHYSLTSGVANVYISMGGLLGVSYLPRVEQGGLDAVGDFWTGKGSENQFAVWRNFLIAVCWAVVCVGVGIILPPFRTSRQMITRGLFPMLFKQVDAILTDSDKVNVRALEKLKSSLKHGKIAAPTVFEPRIFHLNVDLVTPVGEIAATADELAFKSLLVLHWRDSVNSPSKSDLAVLDNASKLLGKCGAALTSKDQSGYQTLRDCVGQQEFDRMASVGNDDRSNDVENPEDSDACFIYKQVLKVRTATLDYLRAFYHGNTTAVSAKQQMKKFVKRCVVFVTLPLIPTIRLFQFLKVLFMPKKWDLHSIAWAVELVGGFVALMCMSVYWDAYANFRIPPSFGYVGAVYSGWQLMGYAFSWRPTKEGTVKKGIMRIIGTCLGGFMGWLGIIVCSWSYDDEADINPYGLVAWLTVFTMLCSYFYTLDPGPSAHSGNNKDHGYVGLYFTLTQALIALETFLGAGSKNGLTANRIVATITGVLMSMIISILPPHVNGRDPEHSRAYLNAVRDAFMLLLKTFVDENESKKITDPGFKKTLFSTAASKRDFAMFVLNDADMLQILPFFKVNEELRPLLDSIGTTEAMVEHLGSGFSQILTKNINVSETRASISSILDALESAGGRVLEGEVEPASAQSDLSVAWTLEIANQLNQLRDQLDKIESE